MAVDVVLNTIGGGYNRDNINENFDRIAEALQDAVSRSDNTDNELSVDLDLNGNDILNGGIGEFTSITLDGVDIVSSGFQQGDRGWAPVFAIVNDGNRRVLQLVSYVGGEGDTPTENIGQYVGASGYTGTIGDGVDIRGATGASGSGTGDMVAAQNLNDVADKPTAFDNIKQAASDTATGVVERATTAEAIAGTDDVRFVTPAGVAAVIAALPTGAVPIGTVLDYTGLTAPTGYLFPYGQAVSRTTYSAYFAVVGTTYGVGNGTTTFNLPDLRGRVVAGKDNMGGTSADRLTNQSNGVDGDTLGASGGSETHSLVSGENGPHTHSVSGGTLNGTSFAYVAANSNNSPSTTANSGSGTPHNNVQPSFILNKILYVGV